MTYELVGIDPATGEEELLGTGTMTKLSQAADEKREQAEDDGHPTPWLRVQPAS